VRFRKKPLVVEAEQFWPEKKPWPKGVQASRLPGAAERYPTAEGADYFIKTLEGDHIVTPGDWIITGVKGERYPCKPGIFEQMYERVDE
jgi:hypothetical protein